MSMNDVLSDTLTRIRNGQMSYAYEVNVKASKLTENVVRVLTEEGFIEGYEPVEVGPGRKEIKVQLRYHEGRPVIRELKRRSKPGRRYYSKSADMLRHRNGLGVTIVSTSKGVMTGYDAQQAKVGGEVLCTVF